MTHLVAEKLAKLLKISIEQADKIAPQLQHEILIDTIASSIFSLFLIVFLLQFYSFSRNMTICLNRPFGLSVFRLY